MPICAGLLLLGFATLSLRAAPGAAAPTPSAADVTADADRLNHTDEGKGYLRSCSPVVFDVIDKEIREHGRPRGHKFLCDLVCVLDSDGHVVRTIQPHDAVSLRLVADFTKRALPAPPRAPWPMHLRLEIQPDDKEAPSQH